MRLSIIAIMLAASFALPAFASPISMEPYPFTVTTVMICDSVEALKSALATWPTLNADCILLSGDTKNEVTATPVEIYDQDGVYGMLTKYSAPGKMDIYGIQKLEPAPSSTTPAPSKSDVSA